MSASDHYPEPFKGKKLFCVWDPLTKEFYFKDTNTWKRAGTSETNMIDLPGPFFTTLKDCKEVYKKAVMQRIFAEMGEMTDDGLEKLEER